MRVAASNPNTDYALSNTVNRRSNVPTSNPRRTSIRRPLRDSTTKCAIAPSTSLLASCAGVLNHFNRNHRPGDSIAVPPCTRLTIFIQRSNSQTSLPATHFPLQSTRFKLRNENLGLRQAPPPPHYLLRS